MALKDSGFFSLLKYLIWPSVVLAIGLYLVMVARIYLMDLNKVNAATNRAYCEMEMSKLQKSDFTICKDIFDSARR